MGVGQLGQQLDVHPLVDHAVEAEARAGQGGLVGRVLPGRHGARLGEVGAIHAGGEGVDVGVPAALGLVQAVAAGEDHVGQRHQVAFQDLQALRGELEVGELVHAVVHDCRRALGHRARELQHHRRVVPDDRPLDAALGQEAHQQALEFGVALLVRHVRQPGRRDGHVGGGVLAHVQADFIAVNGLFEEDDRTVLGEPAHEVLGALEHEIPPQVRKADQRVGAAVAEGGRRNDRRRHCRRSRAR